jgi:hypothetical protein
MSIRTWIITIIAAMAAMIVALSVSNFVLRRHLTAALRGAALQHSVPFKVGETLPEFSVRDRHNRPVRLGGASGVEKVFVFFLPGCNSCETALDAVAVRPNANTAVVSVLSAQLSASSASKIPGAVPLYFMENLVQSPLRGRLRVVPQILRADARGVVVETCAMYEACIPPSAPNPPIDHSSNRKPAT